MEIGQGLLLAAVGTIAGFLNVMAGGGSLLVLPTLVFMGLDGPFANGTNRVAIVAQNTTSIVGFFKKGYSDIRMSLTLSLCALPGAALGAYFGTRLEGIWFKRVLGGLMILLLILMARNPKKRGEVAAPHPAPRRVAAGHLLMVAVGLYGGFIQAGVGFLLMAVLHRVLGLDLVRVNMHKVFIVGVYTLVALATFASKGQVIWTTGLVLAAGNSAGGWLGTHFAVKKGERLIRVILNIVLAVMAVRLLV